MKINENIFSLLGFECQSYKVLDQRDRAMSFSGLSEEKCDGKDPDDISPIAWYRMMGETGDQIPEKCIPINRCGTRAPGWLNGKHPTVDEGIVNRQVCYNWNGDCCNWQNNIKVRNCGDYFVYQLQKPPTCPLRYCGNGRSTVFMDPSTETTDNKLFSLLNQSMSHFR